MGKSESPSKKKHAKNQKGPSAEELSSFALAPTPNPGLDTENIFGSVNYKQMKGLLMQRVNSKRYVHSISVAKTARKLARAYGYDPHVARMAGLLHDWDKALKPGALMVRIEQYNLPFSAADVQEMPWVLHGYTAAAALEHDFPLFGSEVFQAIANHTTGSLTLAPLDMIVFVADKIEPTHEVEAYKHFYKNMGQMPLEDMYFGVMQKEFAYLIGSGRPLCASSIQAWNACVRVHNQDKGE